MNRTFVGVVLSAVAVISAACGDAGPPTGDTQAAQTAADPSEAGQLQLTSAMPVFCLDDTGVYQPLVRTNLQRLQDGFARQFSWTMSQGGQDLLDTSQRFHWLHFSQSAEYVEGEETISYAVAPHEGGVALLRMVARFNGMEPEVTQGTEMCGRTFTIINLAAP